MIKVRIVGDTHLGKRFPFTTAQTSNKFAQLQDLTLTAIKFEAPFIFQLGDLFDGYSVSDSTLVKGYNFAQGSFLAISGNHDKSNNTDKPSALNLLRTELGVDVVWDKPAFMAIDNTCFMAIPHQLTQDDFEAELEKACTVSFAESVRHKVLFLHCNYGEREGTKTENYLRPDLAKKLLNVFDLIVSGHEHNHHKPLKGVVMLGSILPFNFGEMTDKVVMEFDTETGEYELVPVWVAENSYKRIQGHEPLIDPTPFTEIVGTVSVEQASAINKAITEWYKEGKVISVKNATNLVRHDREVVEHKVEDWVEETMKQCNEDQQAALKQLLEAVA